MKKISVIFLFFVLTSNISCKKDNSVPPAAVYSKSGRIFSIAGGGVPSGLGNSGTPATQATLRLPGEVALDANGNVYFADQLNNLIRKVNKNGIIFNIAGNTYLGAGYSGDGGPATNAQLYNPYGVAVDNSGNIYIGDSYRIRMVNSNGIISTVAGIGQNGYTGDGGAATAAQISPGGIAVDQYGNLYIADEGNNRIRCVNSSGVISTIAGNGVAGFSGDGGPATAAELKSPDGIKVDQNNNIYIADDFNNRIRKINASGIISTIAGNGNSGFSGDGGAATSAMLNQPVDIALDNSGNIYISDGENLCIRQVNTNGVISTIAGKAAIYHPPYSQMGGLADTTSLQGPTGLAIDDSNNIYLADRFAYIICKIYK